MIQPLKCNSNVRFCANETKNSAEIFKDFQKSPKTPEAQSPVSIEVSPNATANTAPTKLQKGVDIYNNLRNGAINTIKNFNTTTSTSFGFIKGLVFGSVATGTIGVLGKNIKESKGQILGTLTGTTKDLGNAAIKTIKASPSIITKAPIENAKTLLTLPKKFYKEYLKGHKGIATIATIAGALILAYNTLKGKIIANKKNADVDHYTNSGHIKTN